MKKGLIGVLCLTAATVIAARISYINRGISYPPVHVFAMGEDVPLENNIMTDDYENMMGYSVSVDEADILSYDEFLKKYQYSEKTDGQLFQKNELTYPEMVYDLKVVIKNNNTEDFEDRGIDFRMYRLTALDFQLQISNTLYAIANPSMENGEMTFRLLPKDEMEFHLPFYFTPTSPLEPIKTEELRNTKLYLPVCYFPEQRQICIKETSH